jgi:hypothetical protein
MIRDTPSKAGFADFDTGDASSGDTSARRLRRWCAHALAAGHLIIVAIEFCSGFLRKAVMKWYRPFAKARGDERQLRLRPTGACCSAWRASSAASSRASSPTTSSTRAAARWPRCSTRASCSAPSWLRWALGHARPRLDRALHVALRDRRARHALGHGLDGLRRLQERRRRHRRHRRLRLPRHRHAGALYGRRSCRRATPLRPCSGWGLPCRSRYRGAVGSYPAVSPCPVRRDPKERVAPAVCFLWHFPRSHLHQALPGTLPCRSSDFPPAEIRERSPGPLRRGGSYHVSARFGRERAAKAGAPRAAAGARRGGE